MNLLHDYEDAVLRMKMRQRRRKWVIGGAQVGAVAAFGVWLAFELGVPWSLVGVGVYFGTQLGVQVRRWIADRGVESSSTERELVEEHGPESVRHTIAVLGIVVACVGLRFVPTLAHVVGILVCALVVLVVVAMKLRQDAITQRSEREERWLESADACEVRPRKWTK